MAAVGGRWGVDGGAPFTMNSAPGYGSFYTTLAAVSAAIVGLLGAVLGSRILDHIPRLRASKRSVDLAILGVQSNFRNLETLLTTYMREIPREIVAVAGGVDRDEEKITVEREFQWDLNINKPNVFREPGPREYLEELNRKSTFAHRVRQLFPSFTGDVRDEDIESWIAQFRAELGRWTEREAKFTLEQRLNDLVSVQNAVRPYRAEVLPRSFWNIFLIMVLFVVFGIGWPVLIIPAPVWYSWPFFPFLAGLLLLIVYFGNQFMEVRRLGRLQWYVW